MREYEQTHPWLTLDELVPKHLARAAFGRPLLVVL